MQICAASNNVFEGKACFHKNLPKPMKDYANRLLDSTVNGKTIRSKLAEKSYDMTFFTTSSKKAVNPKLEFYSGFKVLNPKDKKYYNRRVRIKDDFNINAEKVSRFIDEVEDYKKWYDGYNTLGERLKIWFCNAFFS